jgi:hypothetical protein
MRFHLRRRPRPAASADSRVQPTGWDPARHACSDVVDGMPQLESPLVTELIALHAHTRHLGWLSSRETCPDQYRHLARIALRDLLEGWKEQTAGAGRLEDLLTEAPATDGAASSAPAGQHTPNRVPDCRQADVTSGVLRVPFRP